MNGITILQTGYVIEDIKRPVIITDEKGNDFRLFFLKGGGIIINKFNLDNEDELIIKPVSKNEVKIF